MARGTVVTYETVRQERRLRGLSDVRRRLVVLGGDGKPSILCAPVQKLGWGLLTKLTLPGGGNRGTYQPRHARSETMRV